MLNKVTINAIPTYSVQKKDFNFNQIKTRKFDSNTEPVEQSTLNRHHMSNTLMFTKDINMVIACLYKHYTYDT